MAQIMFPDSNGLPIEAANMLVPNIGATAWGRTMDICEIAFKVANDSAEGAASLTMIAEQVHAKPHQLQAIKYPRRAALRVHSPTLARASWLRIGKNTTTIGKVLRTSWYIRTVPSRFWITG